MNDLVTARWIRWTRTCRDFVQFQRKLAIKPAVFFLLNNEPCLMPVLLLGSFWLFEIPSCWVRSLISNAFVARFGEWKSLNDLIFVPRLASFAKPSSLPRSLQSPLPSCSWCAFFLLSFWDCETIMFLLLISYSIKSWAASLGTRLSHQGALGPLLLSAFLGARGPTKRRHSRIWANDSE